MLYLKNKFNQFKSGRVNKFYSKNHDMIYNKVCNEIGSDVLPNQQQIMMKLKNAAIANPAGAGGCGDLGMGSIPILNQPFTINQQIRTSEELYFTDWQAQKIIEIPVDDMLRKPWIYEGLDEDNVKKIEIYHKKLELDKILREALRLERLHGGGGIFIGIKDGQDDPSLPVSVLDIKPGSVRFLNAIQRERINRLELQFDPTKPDFGRPLFYFIDGHKIHRSRLLIFDGDPLLPVPQGTLPLTVISDTQGFGPPVLMRLYDSLIQSTGARQAAFHLIQRASMMIFSGDIQSQAANVQGNKSLAVLEQLLQEMSSYKAAMLQRNAGESGMGVSQLTANFGSIPELIETYLRIPAAGSDIPVTRFLGESSKGLNATGDGDLENYYNKVNSQQRHRLEPQLNKLLRLTLPSAGVDVGMENIELTFPPLWNATELEQAQVRQVDTANITALTGNGLLSDEEAIEELKQRSVLMTNPADFPPPPGTPSFQDVDLSGQLDELRNV